MWQVNGHYSKVYPGVMQGLDDWKQQGLKMVCVTNKPTAFAKALLADKGLAGLFQSGGWWRCRRTQEARPHAFAIRL